MQAARRTPLTAEEAERSAQESGEDTPEPAGRKLPVVIGVAITVLLLDVISKLIVVHTLSGHDPIRLLGGFLTLLLLRNSGAAFSIGTSMTIVFTAIAAAVIVYILRAARKLRSLPWAITLGLLLGGATGNLADRIFRSPGLFRGDVVDWIELPHWPVFNLADSAIVCGGALAVLLALRGMRLDGSREGAPGQDSIGQGSAGQDSAGQDSAGPDRAVRGGAGEDRAGQDRAGQDRAGQDRAVQGDAGRGGAGEDRAGEDRAGEDRAGQDRAVQGGAGEDRAGQNRAGRGGVEHGDDGARPALSTGARGPRR